MCKALFLLIFFIPWTATYAGDLYKWKDKNGRIHITEHLPDEADAVSSNTDPFVNKINVQPPFIETENNEIVNNNLEYINKINKDLDIAISNGQNKYDSCMRELNRENFTNSVGDIIAKAARKSQCEIYLLKRQYNSEETNIKENNTKHKTQDGIFDQYGVFYTPSGNDFINTKTGSLIIHQGGNNYLDTKTGKIVIGH